MLVYFITRFSIYDPEFKGFRITTRKSSYDYEKELFSKNRMDFKFDVFQKVTFESIINQTNKNWVWMIYTSDRLPFLYLNRLKELENSYSNIYVITVKNFKEFFEKTSNYNYLPPYATVRIDDDDALSLEFVEKLQKYSNEVGRVVSFTEGRLAKFECGKLTIGKRISEENNAQGLAGIGINIYACGRHSDINLRYKVIYDKSPNMYLLTCSDYTDTKRGFSLSERMISKLRNILYQMIQSPSKVPRLTLVYINKIIKSGLKHWK